MKRPPPPFIPHGTDGDLPRPLRGAFEALDKSAIELFQEITSLVGYERFHEWPVEQWKRAARLGMMDLWSSLTEEQKEGHLKMAAGEAAIIRSSDLFPKLLDELRKAMSEVQKPKTARELVEESAPRATRKLAHMMRFGNSKTSSIAAQQFLDREDPKVRKEERTVTFKLDDKSLKSIQGALEAAKAAGYLTAGKFHGALPAIAADVVDVTPVEET